MDGRHMTVTLCMIRAIKHGFPSKINRVVNNEFYCFFSEILSEAGPQSFS